MKRTAIVVSHTHWDREWYLPFQEFRMRLVDLVDALLDLLVRDAKFKHFHAVKDPTKNRPTNFVAYGVKG